MSNPTDHAVPDTQVEAASPHAQRRPVKRSNAARLFGYDVFISFALGPPPRGTQSYASDLARRLRERDFTVFFSEDEAPPGEVLDNALRSALHRAKTLVVVANRATLDAPRWIRKEVEEFRRRHPTRPVIPISVGGALQSADLPASAREWLNVQDTIWLDETDAAVARGMASDALVDRLATAPSRLRSNVRWRWVVRVVVSTLAVLAVALALATKWATDSASRARDELRRAMSLRLAAEAPLILSGSRREGDERALLQLVAAARLSDAPAIDGSLLDAILRRRHLMKLIVSDAPVNSVAFSADGSRVASGDRDYYYPGNPLGVGNNIRVWDAVSGRAIGAPLIGHSGAVQVVLFSPDGARLYSASFDETIRRWDLATGKQIGAPWEAHAGAITAMAISPDRQRIISAHAADETMRVWNAETGELIGQPLEGHELGAEALAFSPDGTRIASGSWGPSLRLWDAKTLESIATGEAHSVTSLAFSPDGTRIVAGGFTSAASRSKDDDLRLWEVQPGTLVDSPLAGHQRMVTTVAWSPDGTRIASGSVDTTIRLWDPQSDTAVAVLDGHFEPINSVVFDREGQRIVTGGDDSTVRVWSVRNDTSFGEPLDFGDSDPIAVAFSADGSRIVSGHDDGSLRVWDSRTRALLRTSTETDAGPALSLAVSSGPDRAYIVSGHRDGRLRIWDLQSAKLVGGPLDADQGPVGSVAWSADGTRIASGGQRSIVQRKTVENPIVRLWDARSGTPIAALEGHTHSISSLAFTADGQRLLTSSDDGTIRQWNARTGAPLGVLRPDASGWIIMTASGGRVVTVADGGLRIRDVETGSTIGAPLKGHEVGVTGVVMSPDGRRVVSGDMEGVIRVWDAATGTAIGTPLAAHTRGVRAIAYSPDGRQLVSAGDDDTLRVWPAPSAWADVLCAKLTRNMSQAEWRAWVSAEIDYVTQCPDLPIPPEPRGDGRR